MLAPCAGVKKRKIGRPGPRASDDLHSALTPRGWDKPMMKTSSICFLVLLLAFTARATGQAPTTESVERRALIFRALPAKHLFARGEDVVLVLSIRNESAGPVFVSRLLQDEFVDFKVSGPDEKEVAWQGKGRIDSKSYSPSGFTVLKHGEKVSARRTISLKNGQGFLIGKSGQYSVTAEYSLEPPEYFAPIAGNVKIPNGSFSSVKTTFCVGTCGSGSQK